MAIVTVAEVKTFLQISVSTYDALIGVLIPQAESLYENVRGIRFFEIEGDTNTSTTIDSISDNDIMLIEKNDTIETLIDDGVAFRSTVTYVNIDENEIIVSDAVVDSDDDVLFRLYPGNSKYVVSLIVGYQLNKQSGNGLKTENIGTYSYTKFDSVTGLPVDIVGMIEQYQSGWY